MKNSNQEKWFLILGRLEGISLLILMFIAMPIKYILGDPEWVKHTGRAHGGLFLAYVLFAAVISDSQNWEKKKLIQSWIYSCLPFGTFLFEKKHFKKTS